MKDQSSDKSTAMTKGEAIEAMLEGKKVRHRHFSDNEWVTMPEPFIMLFEDGVKCHPIDFWNIRRDKAWETDWELVPVAPEPSFKEKPDEQWELWDEVYNNAIDWADRSFNHKYLKEKFTITRKKENN